MPFPKPGGGSGLDQLTGDVTAGPGTGSQAATLATVGTAGTYGSATAVPKITTDAKGRVTGVTTVAPDDATKVPLAGGTMTGELVVPDLSVSGLTGADAATRFVGATASGAPTTGTFAVGDFVIDHTGFVWVCTTPGTPGTWTMVGGSSPETYYAGLGTGTIPVPASTRTTIITTPTLPVGIYRCTFTLNMTPTATTSAVQVASLVGGAGTAMVTYLGPSSINGVSLLFPSGTPSSGLDSAFLMQGVFLLQVTVAGTLLLQAFSSIAVNVFGPYCGYVIEKVG